MANEILAQVKLEGMDQLIRNIRTLERKTADKIQKKMVTRGAAITRTAARRQWKKTVKDTTSAKQIVSAVRKYGPKERRTFVGIVGPKLITTEVDPDTGKKKITNRFLWLEFGTTMRFQGLARSRRSKSGSPLTGSSFKGKGGRVKFVGRVKPRHWFRSAWKSVQSKLVPTMAKKGEEELAKEVAKLGVRRRVA